MALTLLMGVASAQQTTQTNARATITRPSGTPAQIRADAGITGMPMMIEANITTGDAATDATIQALQKELQTKVEALRTEYQAKIKAAIGDRKVTIRGGMMASSTGARLPMGQGMMMRATGTPMQGKPGQLRIRTQADGNVEGESVDASANEGAVVTHPGIFGFLKGLFGK